MQRFFRFLIIALTFVAINGSLTTIVLAQSGTLGGNSGSGTLGGNPGSGGGLTNPLGSIDSLPDFLNALLDAVIQLGVIVLTLAIVYIGFLFVKAQGNEEELRSARSALMWTVIGGLVLLGAQAIGLVIKSTVDSLG
jgi:hypothetical protein